MYTSYAVNNAAPGLYVSRSGFRPPVTVQRDSEGFLMASCDDKESLDYFTDQMGGWVAGTYMPFVCNGMHVGSTDELLRRAALWEKEANSGYTPQRRQLCLDEANRLFALALNNA